VTGVQTCALPIFGNAASKTHSYGWVAEEAVDIARGEIAALIGAEQKEIVFTSGATESDNLAIKGVVESYAAKGNHVITAETEHKAVLDACLHVEKNGAPVTRLGVNADGLIDPGELERAITPSTILICVMYANNETGVIQPIKEIAAIAKKHGVLFFSDATQAAGKIPVHVVNDGIDLMALSAHKLYGPKGIGALYIRRKNPRVKLVAQMDGGGHEGGNRSGTLNVPGIVGFGKACSLCRIEMQDEAKRLQKMRDEFENRILSFPGVTRNGSETSRMPHIINLSFTDFRAGDLMTRLFKDIAVSSGSACTSVSPEPSYVLKAMHLGHDAAMGSLRFALGRFTTSEEMEYAAQKLSDVIGQAAVLNR
jgi:cysteine desulfurase